MDLEKPLQILLLRCCRESDKGQEISEAIFLGFISPKKQTKFLPEPIKWVK